MSILDRNFSARELWATRETSFPLPLAPGHKVIKTHHVAGVDIWEKLPPGTAWEEDETLVLVDEQPEKFEGALVWYSRTWANLPETYNEGSSFAYQFIGYLSVGGIGVLRPRFTATVPLRIQHDFFLTSAPYDDADGVPLTEAQEYLNGEGFTVDFIGDTDLISGAFSPTKTEYAGWVASGKWVQVEAATVENYMGKIWVRKTQFVRAR